MPDGSSFIPEPRGLDIFKSDFRYMANHFEADAEDILKAPFYTPQLLRNPRSYWSVLLAGGTLAGTMAWLDNPARNRLRDMPDTTADSLQKNGHMLLWGATGLLYAYGVGAGDSKARQVAITTVEATGLSSLGTQITKLTFGRKRPKENQGPHAFGRRGRSFVSSATTPAFTVAAGLSEYFDNRWYAAVPLYGIATAVGVGRMGKDVHWLSDVAGSALLGVGTTKLLFYMHRQHDANPSRFRVFPMLVPGGAGVSVSMEWGGAHTRPDTAARLPENEPKSERGAGTVYFRPVLDGATRFYDDRPEIRYSPTPAPANLSK